jgi:uroporphyrinogen-III decarboxylase
MPETQKALKALLEAGQAALEWITRMDRFRQETEETGFACVGFPCAIAPFDYFADLLRGSRGVMMDLFRRPDKLLAAMEKIIPLMINGALSAVTEYNNPLVFMPLHKGADGWMSDEQFRKFYWPSLKSIIIGLTDQGCVPLLFAEGGYNSRIEYINELPKGSCIWFFDRTDMKKAKEVIGANTCIMGNVPSGLILTSTPEKVGEYCKDLIDTVGKDGGYIMAAGTALDEVNADNLRAMFDTTREYGRY